MANASWADINSWVENDIKEVRIMIKRTNEEDLQQNGHAYELDFTWFSPNQIRKQVIVQGDSIQEILSKAKAELGS